jgi:Rrf2 family cysteine metabolism transcriptional repressor
MVSNKCEYALRAIFELALRASDQPRKVQDIASAQGIPPRFLEIILVELKNAGFVASRRGSDGGYSLARPAREIAVSDVIRLFHGAPQASPRPERPAGRTAGDFAFAALWERAQTALWEVYDQSTFEDLLQAEIVGRSAGVPDYVI